ncbi:hypothetical protein Tco_1554117 [Tanacetum coccineum]
MDDEPMWAADRVVALTPGSAITILETANEFSIKGNHLTLVKGNQFDGRIKTDPHKHVHEFLEICDMFKYRDTKNEAVRLMMFPLSLTGEAKTCLNETTQETLNVAAGGIFLYKTPNQAYQLLEDKVLLKLDWAKRTVAFADEGPSNSDTDKIMARMDAMTMKLDVEYKELQSRPKQPTLIITIKTHPSRNEHINVVFTRSGKTYDPPVNQNDQQNDSETPINFHSEDEDEESTP